MVNKNTFFALMNNLFYALMNFILSIMLTSEQKLFITCKLQKSNLFKLELLKSFFDFGRIYFYFQLITNFYHKNHLLLFYIRENI